MEEVRLPMRTTTMMWSLRGSQLVSLMGREVGGGHCNDDTLALAQGQMKLQTVSVQCYVDSDERTALATLIVQRPLEAANAWLEYSAARAEAVASDEMAGVGARRDDSA